MEQSFTYRQGQGHIFQPGCLLLFGTTAPFFARTQVPTEMSLGVKVKMSPFCRGAIRCEGVRLGAQKEMRCSTASLPRVTKCLWFEFNLHTRFIRAPPIRSWWGQSQHCYNTVGIGQLDCFMIMSSERKYMIGVWKRSSTIACQASFHGGLICEHLCLSVQTGSFCLIIQVPPLFLVAMTESWRWVWSLDAWLPLKSGTWGREGMLGPGMRVGITDRVVRWV